MIKTSMLILDKRKELGTKYKKTCTKLVSKVFLNSDVESAFDVILRYEPDLILISDSFEYEFIDIVQKIRIFTSNYRPTIVYISKSSLIDDKLKALENGADDYLSEPIQVDELKARIKAHFRRIVETQVSSTTNFYGNRLSLVVLKRALSESLGNAVLLITLDYYKEYKEVYGAIAAEKLIQTYAAIINSALSGDDFLGELSESEFLVITKPDKAEKIAAEYPEDLVLAADTVVACGRRILTKTETRQEAACTLKLLSGRRHTVYGGICLISPNKKKAVRLVKTSVVFARLNEADKQKYLDGEEWRGKAGGYAIQGSASLFVREIIGSYSNVVGLSLYETGALLKGTGVLK